MDYLKLRGKKKWIIGGLLIAVLAIIVGINIMRSQSGSTGITVETSKVTVGNLERSVLADGYVEAGKKESFYANTPAKILRLYVKPGDHVRKGQLLLEMEKGAALSKFLDAQAVYSSSQSDLEDSLRKQADAPKRNEQNLIKANLVIEKATLEFDKNRNGALPTETANAKLALVQAKNKIDTLQVEFDRDKLTSQDLAVAKKKLETAQESERLSKWSYDFDDTAAMSTINNAEQAVKDASLALAKLQQQYDQQNKEQSLKIDDANAQLVAAQAALDALYRADSRREAEMSLADAQAALELVKLDAQENTILSSKLDSYRTTIAKNAQLIKEARTDLASTTVRAGLDGIVLQAPFGETERAMQDDLVLSIGDISSYYVKGEVDEAEIGNLHGGEKAVITSNSYQDDQFMATVDYIQPMAVKKDTSSGKVMVFPVRLRGANTDEKLKPGMSVDVKIISDTTKNVVLVPIGAIMDKKGKQGVFVVEKGIAKFRAINAGISNDTDTIVKSGLKKDETIVVGTYDVLQTLKDGDKVVDGAAVAKAAKGGAQ